MGRMTRAQYYENSVLPQRRRKKITRKEAQGILNRIFKRTAVEKGLIDPSKPKFRWQWHFNGESGEVQANTRGEARGLVKTALGVKKGRLPVGVTLFNVGPIPDRDIPMIAVIEKRK